MKKVCVITATRAEYGLLRNTIKQIDEDSDLELSLVVTGAHLSRSFGYTVKEIENDHFPIAARIDILLEADSAAAISKTMGIAMISFADFLEKENPDMLLVLGDRYELIPFCSCALVAKIPIAHIAGGESTEGAIDECVRHCVTKMSYLHFAGCEEYRQRIIQLGEAPERVFNYGDTGVENIEKMFFLSKSDLEKEINFRLDRPYAVVTFHPETLSNNSISRQCQELFCAIEKFPNMKFIFTKANADAGGREINQYIDEFVSRHKENCIAFQSLGLLRYLSLVKYSDLVLGNSSSGIIEAPCFDVPTVNVGKRQEGRLRAKSVIDCNTAELEIVDAMNQALSRSFRTSILECQNPYGGGNTSYKIVQTIKDFIYNKSITVEKRFYDLPKEVIK